MAGAVAAEPDSLPSRATICLAQPRPDTVIHHGDEDFTKELAKLYTSRETILLDSLMQLKIQLRSTPQDEFWSFLAERMADLLGAQMAFISKRMLVDDQDRAVEMPPIGEPGACLMATALYYNDGRGTDTTLKQFKYHAYGCPCGYMRHDKVFIIPDQLDAFTPGADNPNEFPFKLESYIGIPLFAEGKCFAHFGIVWSPEGNKRKGLNWATIELFLHSIEDIILDRLLEGYNFTKDATAKVVGDRNRIIPHAAITVAQSLKPYARSLSHELRTPMQGVVGMLDVMYATVMDAFETQALPEVRKIFETLKNNIEVVQDSSRRAVEAADNVVHAYDMEMSLPAAPPSLIAANQPSLPTPAPTTIASQERPGIFVAGSDLPIKRPNKRRHGEDADEPNKIPATIAEWTKRAEPSEALQQGVHEAGHLPDEPASDPSYATYDGARASSPAKASERAIAPGLRHTQLRNVLQYVVNEGLKVGGRPESVVAKETDLGEIIEVTSRDGHGDAQSMTIEWSVDVAVPTTMLVDERDLSKLISCVFLNAIKFTDQGRVTIQARMSSRSRHVVIVVTDSGPGIPKAFMPSLFKPFSQKDASLTRHREGLGLGLLVAKGIARKLGGDLMCSRADTEGPNRGSEFEIRVPVSPLDTVSRPTSPLSSPASRSTKARMPSDGSIISEPTGKPAELDAGPSLYTPTVTTNGNSTNGMTTRDNTTTPDPQSLAHTPQSERPAFTYPSPSAKVPAKSNAPRPAPSRTSTASPNSIDRDLAKRHPLTFLVAEDNKINRKLLVSMLTKFGYKTIHEACDGADAVRQMEKLKNIDVVLMDLWMPYMDGYEATEKILQMEWQYQSPPTVLAVTADVTDGALERAAKVGMKGFMTKPFKLLDLQRLIIEHCSQIDVEG